MSYRQHYQPGWGLGAREYPPAQKGFELVKLAAIREEGYPQGVSAPCWFTCPDCQTKMPAFGETQVCGCGIHWTSRGYKMPA